MVLKKLARNAAMEAVDLFRRLDTRPSETLLSDPSRGDSVIGDISAALRDALATPSTVAGWRAQSMFASLVAALDECDLLTAVDMGEVYYDGDSVKAPDFFVHLRDGRRLLVDVKSVTLTADNFDAPITFSRSEISRLTRFAELYGAELHIALFMTELGAWSLISVTDLDRGPGGGHRIRPAQALERNRMSALGDVTLGTVAPLQLRVTFPTPMTVAAYRDASVPPGSAVEYVADERRITEPVEQRLMTFIVLFGGWNMVESPTIVDGMMTGVTVTTVPIEPSGHGFDVVGALSSMYARYFDSGTRGPHGITALDPLLAPGTLAALLPHGYETTQLPLWRFVFASNNRNESDSIGHNGR